MLIFANYNSDYLPPAGTGTIVGPVKLAARREPIVLGKPNKHMFKILEETFKLDPVRTVMVGDRYDMHLTTYT